MHNLGRCFVFGLLVCFVATGDGAGFAFLFGKPGVEGVTKSIYNYMPVTSVKSSRHIAMNTVCIDRKSVV